MGNSCSGTFMGGKKSVSAVQDTRQILYFAEFSNPKIPRSVMSVVQSSVENEASSATGAHAVWMTMGSPGRKVLGSGTVTDTATGYVTSTVAVPTRSRSKKVAIRPFAVPDTLPPNFQVLPNTVNDGISELESEASHEVSKREIEMSLRRLSSPPGPQRL